MFKFRGSMRLIFVVMLYIISMPCMVWGTEFTYLDILPPGCSYAYAYDINNNGDVVGYSYINGPTSGEPAVGFIYRGGNYTEIIPPGWYSAQPRSINDDGEVVGYGEDSNGIKKGFIYNKGTYIEFSFPDGWKYCQVVDNNNSGDIVGIGYDGTTYIGFCPWS